MDKLTIEEKAKAYDKALERAKSVDDPEWLSPREVAEYIFPELKDSDNKRVEIKLIEFFKGYFPDKEWWGNITQRDILTWLEKHEEQISNFKVGDIIKRPNNKVTYEVTNIDDHGFQLDGGHWFKLDRKSEFELVEQKSVNKVEPKFKVGDIVRNIDSGELFHIEKVDSRNYWDGRDSFYIINQEQWERVEQKSSWSKEDEMQLDAAIHLVSSTGHIETANWLKALKDRVQPIQSWSEEDEMMIKFTLTYFRTRGALEDSDIIKWLKSLKEKIQSRPKQEWSEEDKKMKDAIYSCVDSHYDGLAKTSLLIWIKSLKDRIQPQSQQRWDEEDEKVIEDVCYYLNRYGNSFNEKNQKIANTIFQVIDKLKSLRPQPNWKPSNKQIEALNSMTRYCDLATSFDAHDQRIVESLLSDLKKLKGK